MSYVLFARTSSAFGTRDAWAAPGTTGGTSDGRVGGLDAAVARTLFKTYDPLAGDVATGGFALLDVDLGGFAATTLGTALAGGAGAVLAGGTAPTVGGGFDAATRALSFRLPDADWNRIKNLELGLGDAEANALRAVTLANWVDVRVKLGEAAFGDAVPGAPTSDFLPAVPTPPGSDLPPPLELSVLNAKRGEVDARGLDRALDLTLSLASNDAGWQNSFEVRATPYDDAVDVLAGAIGTTAEFGALDTSGRFTLVVADLGTGDDRFSSAGTRADTRVTAGADDGAFAFAILGSVVVTGGDRLKAGLGRDTYVHRQTDFEDDGVDVIAGFAKGADRVVIVADPGNDATVFERGGNTYVLVENGFTLGAGLVQITGATGLAVGTDILFA